MPAEGIPGRLKYRVLDQNSGAVLVPDRPHLHQSQWTVMALLPGSPSAGSIGKFVIPLHPPGSEEFRAAKQWYDLLGPGQRIEGYLGDVITGSPKFSGVFTVDGYYQDFRSFRVGGADTLWWLQQSQVFPGETILSGQTGILLVPQFTGTQEVIWGDNFANWNGTSSPGKPASTDYTASGFSFTSSDPVLGLPALTARPSPQPSPAS